MISNVWLKVFLQERVFPIFSVINKVIKHDDKVIMFYYNMGGLRDNSKPLYDYLLDNGYNQNYKIICSTKDYKNHLHDNIANVRYVSNLRGFLLYFKAGYVFYSVGKIPVLPGKNQKVVQLWHGVCFKGADEGMLKGHTFKNQYYTHFMSTSEWLKPQWVKIFSLKEDRIYVTGQPRNDALFNGTHYDFGNYSKLVIWMPTFRQSSIMGYSNTSSKEIIPLLPVEKFQEFNKFLKERNVKLVIKLHPLQDLNNYHLVDMDNLILLSHSEFIKRKMDLYSFIGQCDAMITDYSSVFFDFLLLDRPIGFTIDDLNEYTDNRGFNFDTPLQYMPGHHMQSIGDLYTFVEDLIQGRDEYHKQREIVNNLFNDFKDNQSCSRVIKTVGIK